MYSMLHGSTYNENYPFWLFAYNTDKIHLIMQQVKNSVNFYNICMDDEIKSHTSTHESAPSTKP